MSAGILGGGEGRIYKHICLNIVGGEHIWPVPLVNLCSIFFSGVGMSRHFSGMGEWKNIQTYFCLYILVGGEHIWPAPLGNLCSFYLFFFFFFMFT